MEHEGELRCIGLFEANKAECCFRRSRLASIDGRQTELTLFAIVIVVLRRTACPTPTTSDGQPSNQICEKTRTGRRRGWDSAGTGVGQGWDGTLRRMDGGWTRLLIAVAGAV